MASLTSLQINYSFSILRFTMIKLSVTALNTFSPAPSSVYYDFYSFISLQ